MNITHLDGITRFKEGYFFSHGIYWIIQYYYIDGLVQDCSISIADALDISQSCTKVGMDVILALFHSEKSCKVCLVVAEGFTSSQIDML